MNSDGTVEQDCPRRIHIIGGPGTGKTLLAKRLAASLQVPAVHLDLLAHEPGSTWTRALADRLADVDEIASWPSWVTEGIYENWVHRLLQRAERVVWLDLPWRVAAMRIVKRHVIASAYRENEYPGMLRLWRFLRASKGYFSRPSDEHEAAPGAGEPVSRLAAQKLLEPFARKLVRCDSQRALDSFLHSLDRTQSAIRSQGGGRNQGPFPRRR